MAGQENQKERQKKQEQIKGPEDIATLEELDEYGAEVVDDVETNYERSESAINDMEKTAINLGAEIPPTEKNLSNKAHELELESIKKVKTEISAEKIPSPEEIKDRVNFREANVDEIKRQERIPEERRQSLKTCAEIFNQKCKYPWYVTGSIAFILNAEETSKKPDDIDIIFNEEDFREIAQEFADKLGFKAGVNETTGCPYIKGVIKIGEHSVDVEAFAQKTETPNGLINPGGKDKNYSAVINDVDGQKFNILDKEGQTELYVKSLMLEFKNYSPNTINEKNKGFNRLANLYELLGNDEDKILDYIKKSEIKDANTVDFFIHVFKNFKEKNGSGFIKTYGKGEIIDVQKFATDIDTQTKNIMAKIETLKNNPGLNKEKEIQKMENIYNYLDKKLEPRINSQEQLDLMPYIAIAKTKQEIRRTIADLAVTSKQQA